MTGEWVARIATPFLAVSSVESALMKDACKGGWRWASGSSIKTSVLSSTSSTSLVRVRRTILCPELAGLKRLSACLPREFPL
jgi:hypothetical protein